MVINTNTYDTCKLLSLIQPFSKIIRQSRMDLVSSAYLLSTLTLYDNINHSRLGKNQKMSLFRNVLVKLCLNMLRGKKKK